MSLQNKPILFGPAGNSESFYQAGHKHTYEAMAYVRERGLSAYEYSFGRGVRLGAETAAKIRAAARENGITLSVHAPYFINLAADSSEKLEKNMQYFRESAAAARLLGATRVVFHPGACAKLDRGQAFSWVKDNFKAILDEMASEGYRDIYFCPETMGKINQIADLPEVIELCNLREDILPTIDFGHLHTRTLGSLATPEAQDNVLAALENGIGHERTAAMHVHFSKIQFTNMGEKAHVTFADEGFGPDFAMLAPLLVKRGLKPTIICESKGTMAEDAAEMKRLYEAALSGESTL